MKTLVLDIISAIIYIVAGAAVVYFSVVDPIKWALCGAAICLLGWILFGYGLKTVFESWYKLIEG